MPQATSRTCPACDRQVPRAITKCRCGQVLPADTFEPEDEPVSSTRNIVIGGLLVVALVGTGYWSLYLSEPGIKPQVIPGSADPGLHTADAGSGTAATDSGAAPTGSPTPSAPAAAANNAAAARRLSAEQAAWNAVAGAAPSTTPSPMAEPAALAPSPAPAAAPTAGGPLEDMIDRVMPAIVLVETTTGRGSAFFVGRDTLITNVHVVQQDSYVTLRRMDGTSTQARVQTRAPAFDIAVLKVAQPSASQAYLPMGSVSSIKTGQEVIVIGSALGMLQNSVSRGIVSGLRNSGGVTLVQSDAAANPGNSGGPMLDRNGNVVGVLTGGYRGQEGLNFAVGIDHARDILDGRQTNLGTGQAGIATIAPVNPGGQQSESDRRQQQGEQEFLRRLAAAEEAAQQIDAEWQRFRAGCYKSPIRGSFEREWFALFTTGALPGDAAAGCMDYFQSMQRELNRFRDFMRNALQDARRANVLPGTVRDTLRSKRLTFDW
jgi:S1-C subfamily serine protease